MRPWSSAWLETSVMSSVAPSSAPSAINCKQVARLGRGVHGRANLAGNVIFDCADQNCFARRGVQQCFSEKGSSGFAVGTGDADGSELAFGMAKEGG